MTATARDTTRLFAALGAAPAATLIARTAAPDIFPESSLALSYPAPTGSLADATSIFLVNARVAALILGATVLITVAPASKTPLTIVLALVATLNVAGICIAVAADGDRAVLALLPHGPVELLAFSRLAALFTAARRGSVTPVAVATALASGMALLALAALLEVTPT